MFPLRQQAVAACGSGGGQRAAYIRPIIFSPSQASGVYMPSLFDPIQFGAVQAANRIVMSPMTRGRAAPETAVPTPRMIRYYEERADAGLIITEATGISRQGLGWNGAPGLWTAEQHAGWKPVVDAVHARGGKIAVQLWHMGRASHPDFNNGELPVAASAIALTGLKYTQNGKKPYVAPRALEADEIPAIVADYARAAIAARAIGFDAVEIHAANGYLIDNFLRDGSNKRTDSYGGSVENRARLLDDVTAAVVDAVGADRTGVRLSPLNAFNDMSDSNPLATFTHAANLLNKYNLAFLDVLEALPGSMMHVAGEPVHPHMRKIFNGPLILNGGYDKATSQAALGSGAADAIALGIPFIANPDLVNRLRHNLPLAKSPVETWYMGGDEGYLNFQAAA
jgi:N-ethylmaleimide reductase